MKYEVVVSDMCCARLDRARKRRGLQKITQKMRAFIHFLSSSIDRFSAQAPSRPKRQKTVS